MALCDECINKGNCGAQEFFGEGKLLLSHCRNFVGEAPRKIVTNFSRITVSPEALAEWIQDAMFYCCRCTADCATACKYYQRHGIVPCVGDGLVEWLKQESDAE